jgi:hypothetical protein
VAQVLLHDFRVGSGRQQQARRGVPQRVHVDVAERASLVAARWAADAVAPRALAVERGTRSSRWSPCWRLGGRSSRNSSPRITEPGDACGVSLLVLPSPVRTRTSRQGPSGALGDEVEVRCCREVPGDESAALPPALVAVFRASFAAITAGSSAVPTAWSPHR